jgi:hypothetical protein
MPQVGGKVNGAVVSAIALGIIQCRKPHLAKVYEKMLTRGWVRSFFKRIKFVEEKSH